MIYKSARSIHVTGLVQGVGFRPFIYRMAVLFHISGWVVNGNDGVRIHAEGSEKDIDSFIRNIKDKAPAAAQILSIRVSNAELKEFSSFQIYESKDYSDEVTEISPDIAVCDDCLADMKLQPHRYDYPFINCTNCGPRFSIIRGLPYDRVKTTMEPFLMCPVCRKEWGKVPETAGGTTAKTPGAIR